MAAIEVRGVEKAYGEDGRAGLHALGPVDLEIRDGEFACVIGPSGCGKSTLLNILARLLPPSRGEVVIDGHRLAVPGSPTPEVRIAYVFQEHRLLPWLTARQNVAFVMENYHLPPEAVAEETARQLTLVGLAGFEDTFPGRLSGGMRQRAAIARALAINPSILLMDEPFSGLDELTARTMRTELLRIWEETRKTVLFVTHNSFEACYLADRVLVMSKRPGRILREVTIPVVRPRDYDDPELFGINRRLVQEFLDTWR